MRYKAYLYFLIMSNVLWAQLKDASLPAPVQEGIRVLLDVGGTLADLHLVEPGRQKEINLVLKNETDMTLQGTLYLGFRSTTFEEVNRKAFRKITIEPCSTSKIFLSEDVIGKDLGMRYVDWHFSGDHGHGHGVIPFAIMRPVGMTPGVDRSGDGFIFGIAGGMRIYKPTGWKKTFFKAAGLIGCEAYRVDMSWDRLEPQKGQFQWNGLDELIGLAREQGIFIQPLMAYGNEWALTDNSKRLIKERKDQALAWRYPVKLNHWADFCRAVASRYSPEQMNYYEIWNEADIGFWKGTGREYADMLMTGYEAIKKANPNIIVTTTGFTNLNHGSHRREILHETFTRARNHFDVLAWHRHGPFGPFADEIDNRLQPLRKKYKIDNKPIVFNETALGLRFEQEWDLAAALVKKMTFSWARGAIGHYWYNLSQSHPLYVMMNDNWTPRPNYVAYNELARHLRGRKFSHEIDLGDGRYAFAFHGRGAFSGINDSDYCIVAWIEDAMQGDHAIAFSTGPEMQQARVFDLMGNSQTLSKDRGLCMATVRHEPVFFELTNCPIKPGTVRPILAIPNDAVLLCRDHEAGATVMLNNPLNESATLDIGWNTPQGIRVKSPEGRSFKLPPRGSRTISLRLSGQSRNLSSVIDINAIIRGTKLTSQITIPTVNAISISWSNDTERPADFVLNNSSQVVNHNDITPSLRHLMWQGPKDLSGKVWLNSDGQGLTVTVDVLDDRHHNDQHFSTANEGDCIEMSLALPGQPEWYNLFLYKGNKDADGKGRAHFQRQPTHTRDQKLWSKVQPKAWKTKDGMRYRIQFRFSDFDLTKDNLAEGFRFNIVIHDNDGEIHEGYIRISDKVGYGKQPNRFPVVIFD